MDGGAAHADGCGFRCRDGTRDRGWPRTATGSLNLAKRIASFGQGLSETSYVAGQDVMIEPRLAEGQLPALATDLVTRQVNLIAARMSVTSGMLRSSAIWQSGSILITPVDKASRRLSETRSSRKSGTRLSASIKEFRPPALRDGEIIFSGLMGRLHCEPLATPAAPPVDFCDPAPRDFCARSEWPPDRDVKVFAGEDWKCSLLRAAANVHIENFQMPHNIAVAFPDHKFEPAR